jgi:hypothetical protein
MFKISKKKLNELLKSNKKYNLVSGAPEEQSTKFEVNFLKTNTSRMESHLWKYTDHFSNS